MIRVSGQRREARATFSLSTMSRVGTTHKDRRHLLLTCCRSSTLKPPHCRHSAIVLASRDSVLRRPPLLHRAARLPENVYFDISYSPVRDEAGKAEGVLCIVCETTERVPVQERQRHASSRDQPPAEELIRHGRCNDRLERPVGFLGGAGRLIGTLVGRLRYGP